MSKSSEKEIKLNISLADNGFRKALYFNRLRVDKDDGFFVVQFGLVIASDLADSYSCVFTDEALKQNQTSLLQYVARLEANDDEKIPWKGVTSPRQIDFVDLVSMSFNDHLSETALYLYSMCAASRRAVDSAANLPLSAEPLVLLRSTKDLQRRLITSLYAA